MRLVFDAEACVGHGRCYALAPELFDADDQGHCVVLVDVVDAAQADRARQAVNNCPEEAIRLDP